MSDADAHPDFLRHHFDTPKQQFEASKLGMWLFLATEVLLFGGLFVGYSVWRGNHPEMFKYGSQFLETKWGAINTAVLITSSLTMAAAVTAAQRDNRRALITLLSLTLAGALGFLGIKYIEYSHKFHEGWFPGMNFYEKPNPEHAKSWDRSKPIIGNEPFTAAVGATAGASQSPAPTRSGPVAEPSTVPLAATGPTGLRPDALEPPQQVHDDHAEVHTTHPLQDPQRPRNAHMFFNIYFMMTGLHGLHVLAGVGVLSWLILGAVKGRFSAKYFTPVDLGGLYWHVVDLIWIYLFPLFYLI